MLEESLQEYFTSGLATGTLRAYTSAKKRYMQFCSHFKLAPLPLTEKTVGLFATYLAAQGLTPQSITSYISAIRHLQIAAGLGAPQTEQWAGLHYVIRGIKRTHADMPNRVRLPITPSILLRLAEVWSTGAVENHYESRLLWAACCLGYFGFLRVGEFTATGVGHTASSSLQIADVTGNSHPCPSVIKVWLKKAKTDPFGKGVNIYLGKSSQRICPVAAILNYIAVRGPSEVSY